MLCTLADKHFGGTKRPAKKSYLAEPALQLLRARKLMKKIGFKTNLPVKRRKFALPFVQLVFTAWKCVHYRSPSRE
eukprot:7669187-Karenia_brevis.AAC.1